jgi:hypothetical protein
MAKFSISQTPTAIRSITTTASGDKGWYNLSGRRLEARPATKGVYVHQGKKIVVR